MLYQLIYLSLLVILTGPFLLKSMDKDDLIIVLYTPVAIIFILINRF